MKKIVAMMLAVFMLCTGFCMAEDQAGEESGWWNILLLGGDARSLTEFGRTDMMLILSINRDEGLVKMTSIMRDTWVENRGVGFTNKINAANVFGGPELAVKTVNACFDMDIDEYVLVNMNGLVAIIDMLGGVDVDVTESERGNINMYAENYLTHIAEYDGDTYLEETGLVHLNGLFAVAYCRDRYSDSDFGRVMRQQEVLLALAGNAQNMDVDELMAMVDEVAARMSTNMTNEQLKEAAMACLTVDIAEVGQFRIPAEGAYRSGTFDGVWCIKADYDENAELLHEFIYGE